jgi:hypothetical protein
VVYPAKEAGGSATGVSVRECRSDGIVEAEWELGERMRRRRGLRICGAVVVVWLWLAEMGWGAEVISVVGLGRLALDERAVAEIWPI